MKIGTAAGRSAENKVRRADAANKWGIGLPGLPIAWESAKNFGKRPAGSEGGVLPPLSEGPGARNFQERKFEVMSMKGTQLITFSLMVSTASSICMAGENGAFSEPNREHVSSFAERKQHATGTTGSGSAQKDFYVDRYDSGDSDYRSHVYGEDSDYLYFRDAAQNEGGEERSRRTSENRGQTRRISGRVEELRALNLQNRKGTQETHNLASLRLNDTGRVLVDLGPNRDISDFDLQKGDVVAIEGRNGRINNRTVLFARVVEVNGDRFQIRRASGSSRLVDFKGEVEGYHPEWIKDQRGNRHDVLKVTNTRGETWLVDLPDEITWRDLDMRLGCEFEARGTKRFIGTEPVLAASSLRVDGEEKIQE